MKTILLILTFVLFSSSIGVVTLPKKMIFPDMKKIEKLMHFHGVLVLEIRKDRLTFKRNGKIIWI